MFVLYRKKIDTIYIFYKSPKGIKKPRGINRAVLGGNYPFEISSCVDLLMGNKNAEI
jgi:hypothetical protein